jgi:Cu2+-exporting ATPase
VQSQTIQNDADRPLANGAHTHKKNCFDVALVEADLGVAIGAGTDVAVESADVVLVRNDPRDVAAILGLSRATYAKIVQNLIWATAYNAVAIPMAAGITFGTGFMMTPAVGAGLMSASTVIVAVNAQLLRFYRKKG